MEIKQAKELLEQRFRIAGTQSYVSCSMLVDDFVRGKSLDFIMDRYSLSLTQTEDIIRAGIIANLYCNE